MPTKKTKKIKLSLYEKKLEEDFSNHTPVSSKTLNNIEKAIEASNKTKTISFRISENELKKIKTIAQNEGLPYQTFISSVLHKYINHRLIEEKEIERAIYLIKKKNFSTI